MNDRPRTAENAARRGRTMPVEAPLANQVTHDLLVTETIDSGGASHVVRTWLPKIKLSSQSLLTLVADVIALAVAFGVHLSGDQRTAVLAFVGGLSAIILGGDIHAQVSSRRAAQHASDGA